jgi:hypothetical protein
MRLFLGIFLVFLCVSCGNKVDKAEDSIVSNDKQNSPVYTPLEDLPFDEFLISLSWFKSYYNGSMRDMLKFYPDGTYTIRDFYGLGVYATGKYEIKNDDEIKLVYPVEFPREMTSVISEKLESLFSKNNELLLKFDRGSTDFYDTYKLFSDNVFFVSDIPSPAGNEYTLDNAVVIKRKGWIKILDVINKRKGPSINSQLAFISNGGYAEEIISFIYDAHEDNETNRNRARELFNRGFVNEKYLERFN